MPKKKAKTLPALSYEHPQLEDFMIRLEGAEGCNFKDNPDPAKITWQCDHDHTKATALLLKMGFDVKRSLEFFQAHGGHCDCEIVFNVGVRK